MTRPREPLTTWHPSPTQRRTIASRASFLSRAAIALAFAAACSRGSAAPTAAPAAISVTSAPVAVRAMPHSLAVTGSLAANQRADVAANTTGKVLKTFVERGTLVAQNDPLVQIDTRSAAISATEATANVETANAQEQLAREQCDRNKELLASGAISKDEWDKISSQCRTTAGSSEAARARAELARKSAQ